MDHVLISCSALNLSREETASILYECITPSSSVPDVAPVALSLSLALSKRERIFFFWKGSISFHRLQVSPVLPRNGAVSLRAPKQVTVSELWHTKSCGIQKLRECPVNMPLSVFCLVAKDGAMTFRVPLRESIQLWGTASTSNREILERFQSKALHMIVDPPSYVLNTIIRRDFQIPTVKEEIRRYSSQYSARLSAHPNGLVVNHMEQPDDRRLRRHLPNDLSTTFLV
jgi:hypothetical protein